MTKIDSKDYLRSNIIDEEDTTNQIQDTLELISNSVAKSLGPYGSTSIIQTVEQLDFCTKDGYTILSKLNFYADIPKTVLNIIKKVSRSLVSTVGDGSTSSVVIANSLFRYINNVKKEQKIPPSEVIIILNKLTVILERYIKKYARPITDTNFIEDITKVATISNNNNAEVGKLMAEIYHKIGKFGFINLEAGNSLVDRYEIVNGINVHRGWVSDRMVNQDDQRTCEFDDPLIFMCNDSLGDDEMEDVVKYIDIYCIKNNKPLVIIAPKYSSSFKAFFDANLQRNRHLPIVAIDIDYSSPEAKERFKDLALVLNCEYYNKFEEFGEVDLSSLKLGHCKKVIITDIDSMFIEGDGLKLNKDNIDKKIFELDLKYAEVNIDTNLQEHEKNKKLFEIKKRIASLKNSTANLYVGGNSELEIETRKFLIEDSVFACRSSIEYGNVIGGNTIIPKIINDFSKEIINEFKEDKTLSFINEDNDKIIEVGKLIDAVSNAFKASYIQVLKNAYYDDKKANTIFAKCMKSSITNQLIYNVKNNTWETFDTTNIINSAETDIQILKSTISIIGQLVVCNQFIATNLNNIQRY